MQRIITVFHRQKEYMVGVPDSMLSEFPLSLVPFLTPMNLAQYILGLAKEYSVGNKAAATIANLNLNIPRSASSRSGRSWLGALLDPLDPSLAITNALPDLEIEGFPGLYNETLLSKRCTQLQVYTGIVA